MTARYLKSNSLHVAFVEWTFVEDKRGWWIFEADILKYQEQIGIVYIDRTTPFTVQFKIRWTTNMPDTPLEAVTGHKNPAYEILGNFFENHDLLNA